MHDMCDGQDGGAFGFGDPYQGYGYGLGGFFDVIAAPFKAVGKGAKFVATKAVPFVVKTGSRFAAASGIPIVSQAGGILSGLIDRPTPYDPSQQMYPQVQTYPQTGQQMSVADIINEIKNAALGGAARQIANTPEGQAAIREQAMRQAAEKAKAGAPWLIGAVVALALITMKRGR